MTQFHLLAAATSLVSAFVYFLVGRRTIRRRVSSEGQLAATMFAVWWHGLAALTLLGGLNALLAHTGNTDVALFTTLGHVGILLLCVCLAGLLYYFAYLFTGRRGAFPLIAAFYGALYLFLVAYVTYAQPTHVETTKWGARLVYERTLEGPGIILVLGAVLVPHLIGAVAYFTLFFRVKERTQRYRIAVIAGAIGMWFLSSLVASAAGLSRNEVWQYSSRLIGIAAAVAILWAYDPPGWVRRRLRVEPVDPQPAPG